MKDKQDQVNGVQGNMRTKDRGEGTHWEKCEAGRGTGGKGRVKDIF